MGPLPKVKPKTAETKASSKMVEDDIIQKTTQDDPIVGPTLQTIRDDLIAGQQDLKKNSKDFLEKNQASQDALQASQNAFQTSLLALLVTRKEDTS
jgi:hypothetical protein